MTNREFGNFLNELRTEQGLGALENFLKGFNCLNEESQQELLESLEA